MASDSETLKGILRELQNIGVLMEDVNEIRNGNYDPPRGANPTPRRTQPRTLNDVFNVLEGIRTESARQTELLEILVDALDEEHEADVVEGADEPFDPRSI